MKKMVLLVAFCIVGNVGAYEITLKNHTSRALSVFAYFRGASIFEFASIGPHNTAVISPESDRHWLCRLKIDSLGKYRKLDKVTAKGIDFEPNKQEGVYSWSGLKRGDQAVHIVETSVGLNVIFE